MFAVGAINIHLEIPLLRLGKVGQIEGGRRDEFETQIQWKMCIPYSSSSFPLISVPSIVPSYGTFCPLNLA